MTEIVSEPILVEGQDTKRSDLLKLIAFLTMAIDHTGALLFPEVRMFRTIGRIAFPIFAWLLVQGFIHTSNRKKYGLRFLYFGLIAQIPYMFLNSQMEMELWHFNVMFLLLLGLLTLIVAEKAEGFFREGNVLGGVGFGLLCLGMVASPDLVQFYYPDFLLSYGSYGLVMMLIFYWTRNHPVLMALAYIALSYIEPYRTGVYYQVLYFNPNLTYWQAFASFDLIWEQISSFKDGFRTLEGYFFQARSMMGLALILVLQKVYVPVKIPKYVGYAFYPVHIILIQIIRLMNGGPIQ